MIFTAPSASNGAEEPSCRVSSSVHDNTLDWSSARRANSANNMSSPHFFYEPGNWHLYPTARRINTTAVACHAMLAVSVEGPASLSISLDGSITWSQTTGLLACRSLSSQR